MTRVTILCAGGHAQDLRSILESAGISFAGYLDDEFDGPEIVGTTNEHDPDGLYLIGHNDPWVRFRLDAWDNAATVVDPSASLHWSTILGAGSVVGPNSTVGPRTRLGRHTHINGNVFVTRARIGDYVTVSPGATICGDVTIGDMCNIGAGAVISNLCVLGHNVTIGAGAVVPPRQHLESNSVWVGVPARRLDQ